MTTVEELKDPLVQESNGGSVRLLNLHNKILSAFMKAIGTLEDKLELGEFSSQDMFLLVKFYQHGDGKSTLFKNTRNNCSENTNAGSAPTVLWQLHC